MTDFGYLSQKIQGTIDGILCRSLVKQRQKLPSRRYVSLCFDDFPQSAALNAAPMIEALGWRATWYVAGGFMDAQEDHYGTMFTAADLQRLVQMGHDIGCHTFDHIDCSNANPDEIIDQCDRNEAFLKDQGVSDVQSFAYPFGAHDLASKKVLDASDFALRGIRPGINRGETDLNLLKACGLQENQGGILRAMEELDHLSRTDGWLIIFTHDVRRSPSPWGVDPDDYAHLLQAVEMSGAEVVTVGDMVKRIRNAQPSDVAHAA